MSSRRPPGVLDSFNYAVEGVIHVLRTQRNMRIHFAVAFVVLVVALVINVTKSDLIALLISTSIILCKADSSSGSDWPLWLLTAVTGLLIWRTRIHLLWLLAAGALLGWYGLV